MNKNIEQAVRILNNGGIVVFPTDTVWGVGCRLDYLKSIEKLYELRRRPDTQAVPILVSSISQAMNYYQNLPDEVVVLLEKYWPGGLTVVYHCQTQKIPALARANQNTIGLRMPNQKDLLEIIDQLGVPILGPSANFHGLPTPTKKSELDPEFLKLVDYVMPGECGGNLASTVVDTTVKPWKIVREGAVKL